MPKQKAAFKSLRKSKKLQARNAAAKKIIKDLRKKALKRAAEKKFDEAVELLKKLQKAVDKASRAGGFMKQNTASRIKSRLAVHIRKLRSAT